jgi:redox-sensitive bicupin YhaK (pirin superfamily)
VQLWVNLPAKDKMTPPKYQPILSSDIPEVVLPEEAGTVSVIAGNYAGTQGAASTYSPVNLWVIKLSAGKIAQLSVPEGDNNMLFIRQGAIMLGSTELDNGDLALLEQHGSQIKIQAVEDSSVILMGGQPIAEPIVASGPFVMNTEKDIRLAMMDYQSGRMGQISV